MTKLAIQAPRRHSLGRRQARSCPINSLPQRGLVWCLRNNYTFVALKLAWGEARGRECIRSDTRPTEQRSATPVSQILCHGTRLPRVKFAYAILLCVTFLVRASAADTSLTTQQRLETPHLLATHETRLRFTRERQPLPNL